MSTFNALLTSISYDDQGAYEVGFAAGVDHATGVVDAGVGAAAGGAATGGADVGLGAAAGGADVDAGVGAAVGGDAAGLSDDDWWSTTDDGAPTKDLDDKWTTDDDWSDIDDEGDFTDDEEAVLLMHVARCQQKRRRIATAVMLLGMYHCDKFMNKAGYRVPHKTGYQWTMRTLGNRTQCYNMFRMHNDVFYSLHTLLVERYGL